MTENRPLRIAIVGGNSQVGTEICLLLKAQGETVIPIVRSRQAAAFLNEQGLECRIVDLTAPEQAHEALKDADAVVLSTYISDVGGPSKRSRAISKKLIRNCVEQSSQQASIIYFSSIRAFSRRVDPETPLWGGAYDREKKWGESELFRICKQRNKNGYALRLGHVFGKKQGKTRAIFNILENKTEVMLMANAEDPSNIVHTVTIADSILLCNSDQIKPGTYSVVNSPQWSWHEVFEYYRQAEQRVVFLGKENTQRASLWKGGLSIFGDMLQRMITNFRSIIGILRPSTIPPDTDQSLQYYLMKRKVQTELSSWTQSLLPVREVMPEFRYKPVPGPFVQGLTDTRKLLDSADIPDGIF